jgi:pilus assembly protein CpaD
MKRADDDAMTAPGIAGGQPFSNTMVATMPKSIGPHTRRQRIALRLSATAAVLCLVGTALSGCNSPWVSDEYHPRLTDPARRHPIVMVAETATLDLSGSTEDKGGEARAFLETTKFVRNYRTEGRGPLHIAVPRGAGGNVSRRVQNVRLVAYRNGVSPDRIRTVVKSGSHGIVTLSYDRISAVGPSCGDWSEDVTRNKGNLPYANFGCATQRNLAAMAANPMDLMYPAIETPRGSETRATDNKNFQQKIGKEGPTPGSMTAR